MCRLKPLSCRNVSQQQKETDRPSAFQVKDGFRRNCRTSSRSTAITLFWFTQFWLPCPVFEMSCHSFWLSPGSSVFSLTLFLLRSTAVRSQVPSHSSGLSTKLTPTTENIFKLRNVHFPCSLQFAMSSFLFGFPFHFYILFNLRFCRHDVLWW